jgi:hypothetical protein
LREAKINAQLYQTEQMKEAISQLYAHIILFFQQAVKWYNMSRASRVVHAIVNPPELEYQETVQQIKFCAETVNELASAAERAEIRDIHVTLQLQHRKVLEMQEQMKRVQRAIDERVTQVIQIGTSKSHDYIPRGALDATKAASRLFCSLGWQL